MTPTEQRLRAACVAYWKHRRDPGDQRFLCARERLHAVADAYRAGWTVAMVEDVDKEAMEASR